MSVAGLFAGIGGFELAFAQAGFPTKLLVEIDPAASDVLRARFPGVEIQADVGQVSALPAGTKIVTAGFPCQNLSMAGDKTGIGGRKSQVVDKMFDLIDQSQVPTVVLENVYFMLQLDRGRAMESLVERFEARGYHWAYRVLDTIGFGLPQRRRRVYVIATKEEDPRRILFADRGIDRIVDEPTLDRPLGFYWTEGRSGIGLTLDGIPPLKVGSTIGIPSPPAVRFPDGRVLLPSIRASERLQGFEPGWTGLSGDAQENRVRWRLVGNAVSVPVAAWVARRMLAPGEVLPFDTIPLERGGRWPIGAWNVGTGRVGVACGSEPAEIRRRSIVEFRDESWTSLSPRALTGFIKRASEGKLRMPAGFLDELRRELRETSTVARAT